MLTQCSPQSMQFARLDGRSVVADFGGGALTSDAGSLLLGATDRAIGLVDRFAGSFSDGRAAGRVVHDVRSLIGQRVFGIALGYEDLTHHDELRRDPALGAVLGKLAAARPDYAPLAGKSTLNRLEHAPRGAHRYHRIDHDPGAVEGLFVDLFLEAHAKRPRRLVLDLDATDDPIHGHQQGRFFHGYYDCYCYLPLYIFCGDHLLAAKLRRSNIDASAGAVTEVARIVGRIRERWPRIKIVLRADSGFAREELMAWAEANRVDARRLCEQLYCARGDMENRFKAEERPWRQWRRVSVTNQLDLFSDRTSAAAMAYVLLSALRHIGLAHTRLARATCGTIRLTLLKIAVLVRISVRRIRIAMASACPYADEFALAHARLCP